VLELAGGLLPDATPTTASAQASTPRAKRLRSKETSPSK
jgi:hypothetical protein